jgi:hypothetical protein
MKKHYPMVFIMIAIMLGSCQPEPKSLVPDPGVVSFTFRNQFAEDVPGTLDMIKEMGITNIEFSNLFGKTALEMRVLLDERGMVCTSYGVGYDRLVSDIENVATEALILGAKYVRVAWIPMSPVENFRWKQLRKQWRILIQLESTFANKNSISATTTMVSSSDPMAMAHCSII